MPASTIAEVVTALETIIHDSIAANSRLGYFAALYHKVTVSVQHGIQTGQFQDGPRMERLDVIFANRYLNAYDQWKKGEQPTASWKLAFETAEKSGPLVLQQLLLGMSAHINLDLGVAAVEVSGTNPLQDIHNDFDMINTIISSLTYQVLNDLVKISPLLSLLGLHAGNNNSVLIQFSIDNARDGAWCFAEELMLLSIADRPAGITKRDTNIYKLGTSIAMQNGFLLFTTWVVHLFEWKKPAGIIEVLHGGKKQHFTIDKPNA
ncbi:hypothetical protein SAMN05421788_109151 [Filimonas lacunae]|uniref:Uncharacterized protein n=1 Tax=Filimonas lacunae TaxID=477680 RepID=A0A173MIP0_9BACT|nr:DUF5995 family protein [Filimonas lacunae]BAV07494.1 hypothetical protein FLA_3520 [Filimonas lacunae]SIT30174.1 hypothetical protein SAMN05421788_109151 [Filimonas lacunae]